jgi:diguanylate cyclase (GGDEF)-like protein
MTSRAWRCYAVVAGLLVIAYPVIRTLPGLHLVSQLAVCFLGAVAILLGAPRGQRAPWWLFAAGIVANTTGVPVMNAVGPPASDVFYLSFYPCVALGLVLLIRRQRSRSRRAALVDAATIAVGLGLLTWVYAISPALDDPGYTTLERLIRVSFPAGDLILIALTVLLIRNGVPHQSAPRWIAFSLVTFLIGDICWLVVGTLGLAMTGTWIIDMIYMTSFVCFGLAVRRAADTALDEPPGAAPRSGVPLMLTLAAALLVAPALLVVELADGGEDHNLAIAVGCAITSILVVTRMFQLLRHSERQAWVVRELSRRDELTGLPNRRAWVDELPRVLERAFATGEQVSIGMLDLDRFKSYNDQHGHPAGDRLLKSAAAAWSSALRRSDILARYGGEEFIVLLPGADQAQATMVLERVRAETPEDQTFSAGVATWDYRESPEELIARADAALYRAKDAGRDRIVSASDPGVAVAPEILGT